LTRKFTKQGLLYYYVIYFAVKLHIYCVDIQYGLSRRLWLRSLVPTSEQRYQVSYVDGTDTVYSFVYRIYLW